MRRANWKTAAAEAGSATVGDRLRSVTSAWAAARQDYLTLWDARPTDVVALGRAIRKFESIDRLRRSLASQLDSAA